MSRPSTPVQGLAEAQREWQAIFAGGPYTGLKMLEYIMTEGHVTHQAFLTDAKRSIATVTTAIISKQDINKMAATWVFKTGRCTSLAVKAVYDLSRLDLKHKTTKQPLFNFCIYDLGRHRIARCRNTGIVIDSSSSMPGGAFDLQEGTWQRFEETQASWKFKNSESKFESQGDVHGRVKSSSTAITPQAAMVQCLQEIAESAADSVPTLFRTVDRATGVGLFHGLVVWAPRQRAIKMAKNTQDWKDKRIVTIQWAQQVRTKAGAPTAVLDNKMQGTEQDLKAGLTHLSQFIQAYGGPNGAAQWEADGIDTFTLQLVQAACDLWGFPKLI
ncbi:hypothetical protein C8A00DRAFT_36535 [Chaetomidium leptoderma]|uniref:Uncharacterized protein n=1 Tax=Chaetomidium leptoderma TaxID=669021 RepID=A0AAN6ZT20_9PEZI|nr:hypothetical protein C8A00DRAFT_36535 [Chaetomidium leptoderma]